jgi:2-keto-4-pentenoate hydratase
MTRSSTVQSARTDAAQRLLRAERDRVPCNPVRELIGSADVVAAYAVQSAVVADSVARGRVPTGRKIGLTSPAVQAQLGVDQPDFGVLFADMDRSTDDVVRMNLLMQPKAEAEVAFALGADIDIRVDAESVRRFVALGFAAIEIVDSRIAGWDITLGDTVADNASSGLYVLGDQLAVGDLPELAAITMSMSENGTEVSTGVGSDCLGSPWAALAWLANTAREFGSPLRAGEVVLSGALGPMVPVRPGGTYTATVSGIGSVSVTFAGADA